MNRTIGLHLQFHTSITAVARKALQLQLPSFQTIFVQEKKTRPLKLTKEDKKEFLSLRPKFHNLYAHASFLINFSAENSDHPVLLKELFLCQSLEFNHYVFHPGAWKDPATKTVGLDRVAQLINKMIKAFPSITFYIENTANKKSLLGADINDLIYLFERTDKPEQLKFCLDTAHAHLAGYSLEPHADDYILDRFSLFKDNIQLIHLNDSNEERGSFKDIHALPGYGKIGTKILKNLIDTKPIDGKTLIIEPSMSFEGSLHDILPNVWNNR
ncbi:deoxyribonuclease IV [bacterium]|nr:MAG: deoxyribonuclease IV [bacterium]QQR61922.1 MAG: deoxyribonuclease IV [bacterium]QQR62488.1 MAG: deoxyribonuclease IV [bacterium]